MNRQLMSDYESTMLLESCDYYYYRLDFSWLTFHDLECGLELFTVLWKIFPFCLVSFGAPRGSIWFWPAFWLYLYDRFELNQTVWRRSKAISDHLFAKLCRYVYVGTSSDCKTVKTQWWYWLNELISREKMKRNIIISNSMVVGSTWNRNLWLRDKSTWVNSYTRSVFLWQPEVVVSSVLERYTWNSKGHT